MQLSDVKVSVESGSTPDIQRRPLDNLLNQQFLAMQRLANRRSIQVRSSAIGGIS